MTTTQLAHIQPFVYTSPAGLKLEVLFVLSPEQKGYINATAIAKQFGKEPYDWLKYKNVQDYIGALLETMNRARSDNYRNGTKSMCYDDMVVIVQGGSPEKQGTWLHPKLGVVFARWLSPHFAVWCDEQIGALLHQHPEYQQQFPELAPLFTQALDALEQRMSQRMDQLEQVLNRFHVEAAQDTKHTLGQIHNGIHQLQKVLNRQSQMDMLHPPVQETIQKTLLDYQQTLEHLLRGHQDELIQGYLAKIKENLERIVRRFPEPAPTPPPTPLIAHIEALKIAGQSWNRIAEHLNACGTATPSGKGKWYGSSVKRYVESSQRAG